MKIVLFGAGKDGIKALHNLGKDKIDFFVDNKKRGKIEDIPIISLEQLSEINKENLLILIASRKHKNVMEKQLKENGYINYLIYDSNSMDQEYHQRLSVEQWGELYNETLADTIIENLETDNLTIQTRELIKLTEKGNVVLEIGCGSGETSLALAKENRIVTAIDYSQNSINLVNSLVKKTGYMVDTYCIDALNEFPFKSGTFDVVFQAGLLEHFEHKQRIEMLSKWKNVCKKMVSLIPNAHCLAYRAGKQIAEKNGTWMWGLELPQETLIDEFKSAGYVDIEEYTIGEKHALNFLPQNHYLRVAISKWIEENPDMDNLGQGYLLVTVAQNPEFKL